jgi:hypothetical protein
MLNPTSQPPMYIETQRVHQRWIWLLVLIGVLFVAWMFVEQIVLGHPVGNNPAPDSFVWAMTLLVGIGLPLLVRSVNLTTEIRADRVVIRYFPFWRRIILLKDIAASTPCKFRPMLHYGGWGIRYGIGRGMCYTLYGNTGVRINLTSGRQLLIGSQRPEELAAAIGRAKGKCPY